jgi:hypothetical protein
MTLLAVLLLALPHDLPGPAPHSDLLGDAFQGLAFGDSVLEATKKLDGQQAELRRVAVDPPVLPLARETQPHLIARDVHSVGVAEVAFTFADDALVLVEVRGGGVEGLLPALEEEPLALGDHLGWIDAHVVAHVERDVVWLLSEEALHPHLYLWENPDLSTAAPRRSPFEPSARAPEFLEWGAELEDLFPRIRAGCTFAEREEYPPWLPTNPTVQVQVDAYGVPYAGFLRKIECVFGDGTLQLAWILTGAGEEARVREALVAAHGEPVFVSRTWEAFDGFRVALRKDKPEVLMIADELVASYERQIRATAD